MGPGSDANGIRPEFSARQHTRTEETDRARYKRRTGAGQGTIQGHAEPLFIAQGESSRKGPFRGATIGNNTQIPTIFAQSVGFF